MVVAMLFGLVGIAYGVTVKAIEKAADVPRLMAEGIKQLAPVLVLFFTIAQFLAWWALGSRSARGAGQVSLTPAALSSVRACSVVAGATPAVSRVKTVVLKPACLASSAVARTQ